MALLTNNQQLAFEHKTFLIKIKYKHNVNANNTSEGLPLVQSESDLIFEFCSPPFSFCLPFIS